MKRFLATLAIYVLLAAGKGLSRVLPHRVFVALGAGIGRLAFFISPREVRIALAQLRFVRRMRPELAQLPQWQDAALPQLVRGVFAHVGESVCEMFILDQLLACQARPGRLPFCPVVQNDGEEISLRVISNDEPAMALSGHLGSFEVLCAYHALTGFQVSVFGKEPRYPMLSRFVDQVRGGRSTISVWRDGRRAAEEMIRAVKEGRTIAVLIDQDTALQSVFTPFFDRPAAVPVASLRFALRHKLPLITTFIVREARLRHRVISEELSYDPHDPAAVEKVVAEYTRRLERLILQYPAQWLWWHRRWRRRPGSDTVCRTAEYLKWLDDQQPQPGF